ncbi:MAG: Zn-dependent hydrolase, partial [Paracoccaceae bacterium]|nr:Zn-dependent hydrolase [Paracoccaceae bacterium]
MAAPGENLRINGERLWESLMEMARIGPGVAGGNNRQTVTDEDGEGRALFQRWCEAAGCTMGLDEMGNMFAERPGTDPDALPVYVGSHLDTQPTGGKYDGVLGVLGGLEIVRTLNDLDIKTKHPIVVTNWTNEEGTRFAPAMLASGVFAGVHEQDWAYAREDAEGKSFGAELERIGYKGEGCGGRPVGAYFEAHIEQGPILEAEGKTIGVVTGAQGQRWYEITLTGQEAHAGPTPMNRRRDALVGASVIAKAVSRIGHEFQPDACSTVGMMQVYPNSRNVIPGRVFLTVDLRHPDDEVLAEMDWSLRHTAEAVAKRGKLELKLEQIWQFDATPFDPDCIAAVRAGAERYGHTHRDIVSGAGHDAVYMAGIAPTGMIFVPCEDGISHNEIENA